MQSPEARPMPPPVADLEVRIAQWRTTRSKKGPIPDDIWAEATRLARRHGIYPVSSALRLNYEALKGRVEGSPKKQRRADRRSPAFVQLDPLPGTSSPSSTVEVESPGGLKLTIRLSGVSAMDVVALVDAFLGNRR